MFPEFGALLEDGLRKHIARALCHCVATQENFVNLGGVHDGHSHQLKD